MHVLGLLRKLVMWSLDALCYILAVNQTFHITFNISYIKDAIQRIMNVKEGSNVVLSCSAYSFSYIQYKNNVLV